MFTTPMTDHAQYEYVISAGEGTLIAYGVANSRKIRDMTGYTVMMYGNVTVITDIAIGTTETGKFVIPVVDQLF